MRRLLFLLICAISVVTLLSACYSRIDADYGTSHKLVKINQIHNPDAEGNLEPVEGVNGVVAKNVVNKYETGFKEKESTPTFTLSVGGGK